MINIRSHGLPGPPDKGHLSGGEAVQIDGVGYKGRHWTDELFTLLSLLVAVRERGWWEGKSHYKTHNIDDVHLGTERAHILLHSLVSLPVSLS